MLRPLNSSGARDAALLSGESPNSNGFENDDAPMLSALGSLTGVDLLEVGVPGSAGVSPMAASGAVGVCGAVRGALTGLRTAADGRGGDAERSWVASSLSLWLPRSSSAMRRACGEGRAEKSLRVGAARSASGALDAAAFACLGGRRASPRRRRRRTASRARRWRSFSGTI